MEEKKNPLSGDGEMISVSVKHGNIEIAISSLRKRLLQDGILREVKERSQGKRGRERLKTQRAERRRKKNAQRWNNS